MLTVTQNTHLPGEMKKPHFNSKLFLMDPSFLSKVKAEDFGGNVLYEAAGKTVLRRSSDVDIP